MNIQNIRTLLETVSIPNTVRTLGSEKAVRSVEQHSDGIHIALHFGFPVAHIASETADRIQEILMPLTGDTHIHLSMDTEISTHKVQPGVTTIKGVKTSLPSHREKAAWANQPPLPTLPPRWRAWAHASACSMPTFTARANRPCWVWTTANPTRKTKN